jgi:hypothetical protein
MLFFAHAAFGKGEPMGSGAAEASFKAAMTANQIAIAGFLSLPCVTDSGKSFIGGLQAATTKAMKDAEAEYKDYMAFVTKPMEGNGKCDGGFQGVEVEAHRRHERSMQAAHRIQNIANAYQGATQANLFGPVIIYTNFAGESCLNSASGGYDALETGANNVQAAFDLVRNSMLYEADQFAVYEARNRGLRIRCGEHPDVDLQGPIRSVSGQGTGEHGAVPAGDSHNGSSSITGIEQDEAKQRDKAVSP